MKYFAHTFLSIFLILMLLPQYIFFHSLADFVTIIFITIFLFLLAFVNRIIFALFFIFFLIISVIKVHLYLHWGDAIDLISRLNVFLQSPKSETEEYLRTYMYNSDYLLIISATVLFFLVIKTITYIEQKQSLKSYLLIVVFFAILQNQKPLNLVTYYFISSETSQAISKRKELLLKEKDLEVKQCKIDYDTVLIIQGESANKNHMSIYNYSIETTPFLNGLSKMDNFYKYDIIAPSNQTRYSVPMMLTDANVNSWYKQFSNSVSIVTKLKRCGFQTQWISTQGRRGLHEDSITSIAEEASSMHFLDNKTKQDEEILEYLRINNENQKNKQAYIFHIMGSHFRYSSRYTEHRLYNKANNITNEYDNSIFSTDFLLKKIFKHFSNNKKILLIYFSDHGEVVSNNKSGHGYYPGYKDEYDIPFIMYSTISNNRLKFSEKKRTKLNGESINKILEYVIGISNDNNFSYSSEVFSLSPKNKINYEDLDFYH